MKMAYQSLTWKDYELRKVLAKLSQAGYQGIELIPDHYDSFLRKGEPGDLSRIVKEHNLEPVALARVISFLRSSELAKELKEVFQVVDLAKGEDFGILMLVSGDLRKGAGERTTKEEYQSFIKGMNELGEYASEKGITVSYHPHLNCLVESREQMDKFFDNVSEKITMCPDVAHLAGAGVNVVQTLRDYADRISYVHLKDWHHKVEGDFKFVALGKGDGLVDFDSIFKTFKEIKYNGWYAVELDYAEDPWQATKDCKEFLNNIESRFLLK